MNTDFIKQFTDTLDQKALSRRDALGRAGRLGVGAAIAVTPLVAMATEARAAKYNPAASARAHGILNYALTLEYLEYFFYKRAVEEGDIPGGDTAVFETIRDHELAHVNLLRSTIEGLGEDPDVFEQDDFDYSAAGFDPFADGNYPLLLALSQGFEDTGVRAYKGRAAELIDSEYLTVALQIHSVEARHASVIRRMRGKNGYITLDETDVAQIEAVYAGEDNLTQAGVDLGSAFDFSDALISQAFDEPLTPDEVLAIAGPFITGDPD
jgi:rubrerythrin